MYGEIYRNTDKRLYKDDQEAMDFKRDKEIPSRTEHIELESCGTLHLTFATQDDKLIECMAVIGKNGVCPNILLNSFSKVVSMYLQSPEPRYKIIEKFKRQFLPDTKGNKITCSHSGGKSCVEVIAEHIVSELEKQLDG